MTRRKRRKFPSTTTENGYYLNEDGWMLKDTNTPDGYHVDAKGVWDGDAVTESEEAAE